MCVVQPLKFQELFLTSIPFGYDDISFNTGSGFESHWVPYWRACTPCHFQYDVIAKLETGDDDFSVTGDFNWVPSWKLELV